MRSPFRTLTLPLVLLGVYAAFLVLLALRLPPERFKWVFSEAGPFETASEFLWLALAAATVIVWRRLTLPVMAAVILCLAAAAREAEFHKAFTGYSVLKVGFYTDLSRGLGPKLIAGVFVAIVVASAVIILIRLRELLPTWRAHRRPWAVAAGLAIGGLAGLKALDRLPGILAESFGVMVPRVVMPTVSALEEGMEAALPVLFGWVLLLYAREHARGIASMEGRRGLAGRPGGPMVGAGPATSQELRTQSSRATP